jgi:glucosamine-phosphate N-acetyltransferase
MDIIQNNYSYDTLQNILLKNVDLINNIKNQYLDLLKHLTVVEDMSDDSFINKINEISATGDIIICYNRDIENQNIVIIGSGTIIYEPKIIHGGRYVGHIEDIVTNKTYRSFGIAKKILEILVSLGNKKNCYKIILDCKDNLIDFYKKNHFKNTGQQMSLYFKSNI